MKAFTVQRYGKTQEIHLSEVPVPNVKNNDVLIEIKASAVNMIDSLIRKGDFKLFLPYKPPFILGYDVAGVVKKVGAKVTKFKVGDEVYSRTSDDRIGTYAEYIAIDETDVALKPKNVSMVEAASLPLVALTAWQSLVEVGHVKKGQKVFIEAGSGGVGTIAIQLAKHLGAYVATTTSAANFDLVKNLGADKVIDYKTDDFTTILKDYDFALFSNKNPKNLFKTFNILKPGGTLVSIVGPPTPDFGKVLNLSTPLRIVVQLLSAKARSRAKKQQINYQFLFMRASASQLTTLADMIEAGTVKPVVDQVFPFAKTKEALAYVESGRAKGKVVIEV